MKLFQIAIIGTGMIYKSHVDAIRQIDNAVCVAVCDMNAEKAQRASALAECPCFTDAETMLKAMPDIDICLISAPTYTHAPLVELCSRYRKAILCEKPLEMTVEDGWRIKRAVQDAGVLYMTAQVVRFWTGYTEIKRMMDAGEFGTIYMSYFSRCSERQYWDNDWLFDPKLGGGALHDMMVHDIDFMNYLFGKAHRVYAIATKDDTACYENVFASLEYENGAKGVAETSFTMRSGYPFTMQAKIMGSKATVEFVYSAGYDINQRNGAHIEMHIYRDGYPPRHFSPEPYDAYASQLRYFLACLEDGRQPDIVTVDDSLDVIKTIEAIEKSAISGEPVCVDR